MLQRIVGSDFNPINCPSELNPTFIVHSGTLHEGKITGEGTYYYRDGTMKSGTFVDGNLIKGKYIFSEGWMEGIFSDSYLKKGTIYSNNGHIWNGEFINRKIISGYRVNPDGTTVTYENGNIIDKKVNLIVSHWAQGIRKSEAIKNEILNQ